MTEQESPIISEAEGREWARKVYEKRVGSVHAIRWGDHPDYMLIVRDYGKDTKERVRFYVERIIKYDDFMKSQGRYEMGKYSDMLRELADHLDKDFGDNVVSVYKSLLSLVGKLKCDAIRSLIGSMSHHFKSHDSEDSVLDEIRIFIGIKSND